MLIDLLADEHRQDGFGFSRLPAATNMQDPVRLVLPFKDQASADIARTQLNDLSQKSHKSIVFNITIEFMFAGINMFWARLRLILSLRRAQNILMPKNINSITINITLEGIEKIKTEKNDNKTL